MTTEIEPLTTDKRIERICKLAALSQSMGHHPRLTIGCEPHIAGYDNGYSYLEGEKYYWASVSTCNKTITSKNWPLLSQAIIDLQLATEEYFREYCIDYDRRSESLRKQAAYIRSIIE